MLEEQHSTWDTAGAFTLSSLEIRANEVLFLDYTMYLPVDITRTSDSQAMTLLFRIDHTENPWTIKLVHSDEKMAQIAAFELTGFVYTLEN
jgi:hypothetical protein